ncbi:MAG: Flp pilus assembly complex ATPase component TadA [Phycisphaeraceae bacterium]|nr:Flp pilus assembly complex ATPase component TadA [Phycisphaerales bacterium]MCB9861141.1 Flp pilus assembly complex ATPase component TadA [Phycisphaeraceae bacterium]
MTNLLSIQSMTLAEFTVLVSPWKPILMLVPFVAWAWFLSTVIDKQADRFHLGRNKWNAWLISVGLLGFVGSLLLPIASAFTFLISLGIIVVVLGASLMTFISVTNKDPRVPEHLRIRFDTQSWKEAKEAKREAKLAGKAELTITGPGKVLVPVPEGESEAFVVRTAAERIYIEGRNRRATQVDVALVAEGKYGVSVLVDGVPTAVEQLPAQDAIRIIDFWKAASGLDVADRRKKQVGTAKVAQGPDEHEISVTTSGVPGGMQLTMVYDPSKAVQLSINNMGFSDTQLKTLRSMAEVGKGGLVLVAGAVDGGRTTLLYALTKLHDPYTLNIETVEIDVEDDLEGVRQNVWVPKADGPDFGTFARSSLRRDPQVVTVMEMPDQATAKVASALDDTRTRLYLGLRTRDTLKALQTYVQAVGDVDTAVKPLAGVVSVRLMRRLCQNCRQPYKPDAAMLQKLGLPADRVQQLFKKGGQVLIKNKPDICPACNGSGYFGMIGVYELIPIEKAERELIKTGNLPALRASAKKRQLPTMQQAAILRAVEGVTSVEEVMRVMASSSSGAPSQAATQVKAGASA